MMSEECYVDADDHSDLHANEQTLAWDR